jgi:threonine synthase
LLAARFSYKLAAEANVYRSTRSDSAVVTPERALLEGMAPDGGLYVPASPPRLDPKAMGTSPLSYADLSYIVLKPFFSTFEATGLREALKAQAERFPGGRPAPLVIKGGHFFLELFHGPTLAFKDLALTLMGPLLELARAKLGIRDEVVILVATSGDTGKAALEGLARPGRPSNGIRVLVFYPSEGVSLVQKLQMTSHDAPGAKVIGIRGNFDDAQRGVKAIFASPEAASYLAERGMRLSSANSINIARLLPQIVYYVSAWRDMRDLGALGPGEAMDVAVPTGNFGNILAAWYAKRMGLPIGRLICASNRNRVLTDFFHDGRYDRNRPFFKTESPSMDILVSSNLERLVFHATGEDPARTSALMRELAEGGRYSLTEAEEEALSDFEAGWAGEDEAAEAMRRLFEAEGYLIDPHTAVALAVLERMREERGDSRPTLVASTASPFKFPYSVAKAIGLAGFERSGPAASSGSASLSADQELDIADRLAEAVGLELPEAIRSLRGAKELHGGIVEKGEMQAALERELSNE